MTDDEIKAMIVLSYAPGIPNLLLAQAVIRELAQDALRFRLLRGTVERNRKGLLQADFAVMYPDEWPTNAADLREFWTAAIDRNMKGKLP
jgi:hypothetical protein